LGRGRWTAGEERGRPARGSYSGGAREREGRPAITLERGRPTTVLERGRGGARTADASGSRKHEEILGFLMALGLASAPSRPTWSAMSMTSRLKKSSRQLVGQLIQKVESDSSRNLMSAWMIVDDLKTGVR
jgi:hypothetical protein